MEVYQGEDDVLGSIQYLFSSRIFAIDCYEKEQDEGKQIFGVESQGNSDKTSSEKRNKEALNHSSTVVFKSEVSRVSRGREDESLRTIREKTLVIENKTDSREIILVQFKKDITETSVDSAIQSHLGKSHHLKLKSERFEEFKRDTSASSLLKDATEFNTEKLSSATPHKAELREDIRATAQQFPDKPNDRYPEENRGGYETTLSEREHREPFQPSDTPVYDSKDVKKVLQENASPSEAMKTESREATYAQAGVPAPKDNNNVTDSFSTNEEFRKLAQSNGKGEALILKEPPKECIPTLDCEDISKTNTANTVQNSDTTKYESIQVQDSTKSSVQPNEVGIDTKANMPTDHNSLKEKKEPPSKQIKTKEILEQNHSNQIFETEEFRSTGQSRANIEASHSGSNEHVTPVSEVEENTRNKLMLTSIQSVTDHVEQKSIIQVKLEQDHHLDAGDTKSPETETMSLRTEDKPRVDKPEADHLTVQNQSEIRSKEQLSRLSESNDAIKEPTAKHNTEVTKNTSRQYEETAAHAKIPDLVKKDIEPLVIQSNASEGSISNLTAVGPTPYKSKSKQTTREPDHALSRHQQQETKSSTAIVKQLTGQLTNIKLSAIASGAKLKCNARLAPIHSAGLQALHGKNAENVWSQWRSKENNLQARKTKPQSDDKQNFPKSPMLSAYIKKESMPKVDLQASYGQNDEKFLSAKEINLQASQTKPQNDDKQNFPKSPILRANIKKESMPKVDLQASYGQNDEKFLSAKEINLQASQTKPQSDDKQNFPKSPILRANIKKESMPKLNYESINNQQDINQYAKIPNIPHEVQDYMPLQ